MFDLLDRFSLSRKSTHGLDGNRRSSMDRRTVRPQLEHLEDRLVLSTTAVSVQPPNPFQLYQQLLQAEAHPSAALAPVLDNVLTGAVAALPGLSSLMNAVSSNLNATVGPQKGQQYMQIFERQVDTFLLNLESATLASLQAAGDFQDPTFNADVAFINTFIANPLNYVPPV
jgi:hypothetical protein